MYDYGNARIAAARSRLLDRDGLRRLQEARTPAAMLAVLDRIDDWRPVLAEVSSFGAPPAQAIDLAIERHRSRRLAALVGWFEPPVRGLVEALVLFLDAERLLAVTRRRSAGEPPDRIGAAVAPGVLLDAAAIGLLARAPSLPVLLGRAAAARLLADRDARAVARVAVAGGQPEAVESVLVAALDDARRARASGPTEDARRVSAIIADELAVRMSASAVAMEAGVAAATLGERDDTLARLDRLVRLGHRDPLGIGTVAGYVAAVEAGSIRLRAILTGTVAGWPADLVGEYLVTQRAHAPATVATL
ncbi:MAG TPA: V-type ATPase subunit [Candidatus Limnocylindrales bacterium]